MSTNANLPLATPRMIVYFLAFAVGTFSFFVNVAALVKGDAHVRKVIASRPAGTTLTVDTNNIKRIGYVEAAAIGLIASTAFWGLVFLLLDRRRASRSAASSTKVPLSTKTLTPNIFIFAFAVVWSFACAVPYTYRIARGSGVVKAYIGQTQIPDAVVKLQEVKTGFSRIYWTQDYLRLSAVAAWPAILLGIAALVVTIMARSRARNTTTSTSGYDRNRASGAYEEKTVGDKASI